MPWGSQGKQGTTLFSACCFGSRSSVKQDEGNSQQVGAVDQVAAADDYAAQVAKKAGRTAQQGHGAAADAPAAAAAAAEIASTSCSSSVIPALYEVPRRAAGAAAGGADMLSCDAPSTSYPTTSLEEEWDVLGACMTTAQEMESVVDAVLEGSIKSAQVLFARYDMDLDQRLRQQDYYDLMLELALALPYQEYQRFVDASFEYVDHDRDGYITLPDFVPLYKTIAAVRRSFRKQDHHNNGQIDRYDFHQLLNDMGLAEEQQTPQQRQALADSAFSAADTTGRGIVNFGQTLVWYAAYLLATSKQRQASSRQLWEQLEQQQWQ